MAARSARSPSPSPRRTPESSLSLRKSKEIPQRSGLSRPRSPAPGSLFEKKENTRSRSPAVFKGSRNFMSPTLSAASKAVPPSSRKMILQERNEVTSSISRSLEFQTKEVGASTGSEDIGPRSEVGFEPREVAGFTEVKKGESRIMNHQNVGVPPVSPMSIIPPLDFDPSPIPPYDPKTNYLSPRPQFLRYRPNPLFEQGINREGESLDMKDGRWLDDSLSWESSQDNVPIITEEKDLELESCLIEVEKDLEVKSCSTELEKMEEVESSSEALVYEPEFKSEPIKRRPFRRSKSVAFLVVLTMAFLHVPLSDSPIISSSILKDQPPIKPYITSFGVFEDLPLKDYFAPSNENFYGLARRFRDWSATSFAYFTSVSSSSFKDDDVRLYRLVNVTSSTLDESLRLYHGSETKEDVKAVSVSESETKEFVKAAVESETEEVVKAAADSEIVQAIEDNGDELSFAMDESEVSAVMKEVDTKYAETTEIKMLDKNAERMEGTAKTGRIEMGVIEDEKEGDPFAQTMEMEVIEDVKETNNVGNEIEKDVSEYNGINELEKEASHPGFEEDPQTAENVETLEMVEAEIIQVEEIEVHETEIIKGEERCSTDDSIDHAESDQSEFSSERQISHGLLLANLTDYGLLGLTALLLVVAATLISLYMKWKRIPMGEKETPVVKKIGSVSGSNAKRYPCYDLYENKELTAGGDSCPSEVSSNLTDTSSSGQRQARKDTVKQQQWSHEKRTRRDNVEQQQWSNEKRTRRDSTASSISYGSFTTYERLSAKKDGRDEEVVTPVRRSSRIRNLVTSP